MWNNTYIVRCSKVTSVLGRRCGDADQEDQCNLHLDGVWVRRLEFGKYFRLRRQVGDEEPLHTPCLYLVKTVLVNKTPWPPGRVVDRPTRDSFIKVWIVLQLSYQAPPREKEWRLCGNSQKDRITWNSVAEKTNWSDLRDRLNIVHEHRAWIFS